MRRRKHGESAEVSQIPAAKPPVHQILREVFSGRTLRRALLANPTMRDLDIDDPGNPWTNGGCRIAAEGILRWIRLSPGEFAAEIVTLQSKFWDAWQPDHVVVRAGKWYLDGDGAWEERGILARYLPERDGTRFSMFHAEECDEYCVPTDDSGRIQTAVVQKLVDLAGWFTLEMIEENSMRRGKAA